MGHPTGLPAKLVTSASIKDVEKNYFEADLSMFGGNSGSPIFDRISKKVIGILFQGIGPDYHLVCNYEGLGQHRIKARHATKENIKEIGYEKCQYISTIKVHLTQRIVWLKLQEISEDIECSNFKAAGYKNF
ncbi:MAG: trypsin-like peptidase domain-containing protein [Parachlamydiaceae bacterium]|nr:MAG: trypsin-like peptidase domain-containing protein [Parachlamydiaceae bacterium]